MASKATWTIRLCAAILTSVLGFGAGEAAATPALIVDVDSGQILFERDATQPWYPASLTKLMTTYVALEAAKQGRLTLDTPLTMSPYAASMPPSKMGFRPGIEVTLDNALKMLMVKSPNDIAVMIAENISGSVDSFADEMNATAQRLGLKESHFANPNGLQDARHYSSARDMAMVGRALLRDFPDHTDLFSIGALQLGNMIIPNHNGLLGRYPGADGMKTGFTCPAGFNLVASASQGGRRLIVVVLGAPSARIRTVEAAHLLDRGFAQAGGGQGLLENLAASGVETPPDMRSSVCSRRNRGAIQAAEEEDAEVTSQAALVGGRVGGSVGAPAGPMTDAMAGAPVHFDPTPVFIGPKPGWTGPVLAARPAPEDAAAPSASAYAEKAAAQGQGTDGARAALQGALHPTAAAKGLVARPKHAIRRAHSPARQRVAHVAKQPSPKDAAPAAAPPAQNTAAPAAEPVQNSVATPPAAAPH
ncbi:MAG: D-alanyl-D-alanine carboxypeptidase [Hyphomicrobiales bacterium]|nr:D-alanyl-D-alanine carboxypeptidase [Hyphomicrobiales bacterium]